MLILVVLLGFVVALLSVLVAGLLRSHADMLRALHDLGAGEGSVPRQSVAAPVSRGDFTVGDGVIEPRAIEGAAAGFVGIDATGATRRVSIGGVPHTTLLAFLSSGCSTCAGFWASLSEQAPAVLPGVDCRIVIVTQGPDRESEQEVRRLAGERTVTVMSSEAWDRFEIPGSPYFVLVDGPTGSVVGEGSGTTWEQVIGLLQSALADAGLSNERLARRSFDLTGKEREARADAELRAAGVEPGDRSLYPTELPEATLSDPPR